MSLPLRYADLSAPQGVWVHGHRGSGGTHPENTFPAFEEGLAGGAHLLELDVRPTADGDLVVFHDEKVTGRVCTSMGRFDGASVESLTVEQLKELELGSVPPLGVRDWKAVPGSTLPTFEEVCRWAGARSIGLNVEIKREHSRFTLDWLAQKVVARVECANLGGRVQYQSFDLQLLRALRLVQSSAPLALLSEQPDALGQAHEVGATIFAPRHNRVDRALVDRAHALGMALIPWTVNDDASWRRLLGAGVDGIITDYPRKLCQFLSRYNV